MAYQVHDVASDRRRRRFCFGETCFALSNSYLKDEAMKEKEARAMIEYAFDGGNEFGEGEWGAGSGMTGAFFVSNGGGRPPGGGEKVSVQS